MKEGENQGGDAKRGRRRKEDGQRRSDERWSDLWNKLYLKICVASISS